MKSIAAALATNTSARSTDRRLQTHKIFFLAEGHSQQPPHAARIRIAVDNLWPRVLVKPLLSYALEHHTSQLHIRLPQDLPNRDRFGMKSNLVGHAGASPHNLRGTYRLRQRLKSRVGHLNPGKHANVIGQRTQVCATAHIERSQLHESRRQYRQAQAVTHIEVPQTLRRARRQLREPATPAQIKMTHLQTIRQLSQCQTTP